jgi:predicted membrane channel-forming protein YqfA (hemolysin III family)
MHEKRCSNFFSITLIIFVGLLYGLTGNESALALEKTINWSSIILAIVVGIAGVVLNICIWLYTRNNARKATLYFPLFFACRGIIEIIKDHEKLGEDRSRILFASCARTLDEIVYKHGSIIYLKKVDDLRTFLSLKEAIDVNLDINERNWVALKNRVRSNEFEEVVSYANTLLSRCKEKVKAIKEL